MTEPEGRRRERLRPLRARTRAWWEVGGARQLSRRVVTRARLHLLVLLPLTVFILLLYFNRASLFGRQLDTPVRLGTAVALVILGWQGARDVGRSLRPILFRYLDPATAGTVGFVIRLVTMLTAVLVALRIADLRPNTLAVGGVFTAVIVGLAAQQTLGNLIAGTILVSARPFRVGDRVRLQGGGLAGSLEGVVSSIGLLYTTLMRGQEPIMVPNGVLVTLAVVPLREPDVVEVRARLRPGLTPRDVQDLLERRVQTRMRAPPHVKVEELHGDQIVVRVIAAPDQPADGSRLAGELLEAIASLTPTAAEPSPSDTPPAQGDPAPGRARSA